MTRLRSLLPAAVAACLACAGLLSAASMAQAEVRLPSLFTSHMVLQQKQKNPVWGWAEAGETVAVTIGEQQHTAKAGDDGSWKVTLDPLEVGEPRTLKVAGSSTITLDDVLVGEVWVCSGQSNMQWSVAQSNDADLEIRTANYPQIRLITVPQVGVQEPQSDFKGQWEVCSPETVGNFSGVGYFFGRQLHQTLGVPVGLIDNSWGGSAVEAWIRRDLLEGHEKFEPLMARWKQTEATFDYEKLMADYKEKRAEWEAAAKEARKAGKPAPRAPRPPRNVLAGQHRPANLYNGVLKPIIGYGIRGAIWYQGESNASRAYQYRDLFPLMIQLWRDEWQQGDFPFYWVQLADFRDEKTEPGDSDWAELREAQTMTMDRLPNTGQAVITDLGEAHDIHPKNKQDVAKRLARWALARDYGLEIAYRSPQYASMEQKGSRIVLTFDHVGGGLDSFDTRNLQGFTIAGEDQKFVAAEAKIIGKNQIEVWSSDVEAPVAVRYAWSDNPIANLQSTEGLPATPFRTDEWPGVTAENK